MSRLAGSDVVKEGSQRSVQFHPDTQRRVFPRDIQLEAHKLMGIKSCFNGEFPGSPVVKTLHFQCRGHRFDPWSGNNDPTCHQAGSATPPPKKKMVLE